MEVFSRLGISFTLVDTRDLNAVAARFAPRRAWSSSRRRPTPSCMSANRGGGGDRPGARRLLCVDNTFASPFNQSPLALGADAVLHSTTKYLGGHSDILGGILVVDDDTLAADLHFVRKSTGPIPGPLDSWLALRGTKTLHLRMERHNENAMLVAEFLSNHPAVRAVHYPGLATHPEHELARRQMQGFSGMLSLDLSTDDAKRLAEGTRLPPRESLGGVESMICVRRS